MGDVECLVPRWLVLCLVLRVQGYVAYPDKFLGRPEWTFELRENMRHCKTLIALFVSATLALAADKVSKEIKNTDPGGNVDVIVQYKVPPTSVHFDKAHGLGAADKHHYTNMNAAAFNMSVAAAVKLANDPDVQFVALDRKVKAHLNITAATINANLVWAMGYDGTGVG